MANADEHLNQWLRDAHAMEQQAEEMLSAQASRLEHYPVLRGRSRSTWRRPGRSASAWRPACSVVAYPPPP